MTANEGVRGKQLLRFGVDYAQNWPLDDIMSPHARPDWDALITRDLHDRLVAWAAFFNEFYDWETAMFGSEERRAWFYREAFSLFEALKEQAGDKYEFELQLWQ